MISGQKHLISCRCVLPQFKHAPEPPRHKFIVFSVIENDVVKSRFAQCPNCGLVHKVIEISRSEIIRNRESMPSLITINDIRASLPEQLVMILESNHADLPSWEAAQFIIENKLWGEFVVLTSDTEDGQKQGKFVRLLGERLFKVENYVRDEVIK